MDLTFGEQVKIILSRKGMTIKELAESIEERTGKKMSRQNLTQRLGRDNFQEQDMRMIAGILGCPFHLNILDDSVSTETNFTKNKTEFYIKEQEVPATEEAGAVYATEEELYGAAGEEEEGLYQDISTEEPEESVEEILAELEAFEVESRGKSSAAEEERKEEESEKKPRSWRSYLQRRKKKTVDDEEELSVDEFPTEMIYLEDGEELEDFTEEAEEAVWAEDVQEPVQEPVREPVIEQIADQIEEAIMRRAEEEPEDTENGDVNPYTGHEYKSNSVRMHPKRIGYVQVYDRREHKWTDMTEWAFLGYQERKKALLGKDYEPPIYLD